MDRQMPLLFLHGRGRVAALIPALALLLGACSAAASTSTAARPAAAPAAAPVGAAMGAPAVSTSGGATGSGSSSGSATSSVAYPYPVFGGSAGLAPDHELVVSGTGTATMQADGSDRAAAQRTALAAAMVDAKSQAEAAASDAGVTLGGVVSLSVSVGGGYIGVMGTGEASPPVPVNSTGVATGVPLVSGGSAPSEPTTEQLEVTVTVAYGIS